MATASKTPNWTQEHESALTGLTGLGIGKKEARAHLEALTGGDVAELMRQALSARNRSQKPPPSPVPGGPANAVPLHPSPSAPTPASGTPGTPPKAPLTGWSGAQMEGGQRPPPRAVRPPVAGAPPISGEWSASSMLPTQGRAPNASIQAAKAQLQPAPSAKPSLRSFTPQQKQQAPQKPPYTEVVGAPPGWKPSDAGLAKPRIRVRASGGPVPAAPLGGAGPTKEPGSSIEAPETPTKTQVLPLIHSTEEYEQLAPGTDFIWRSDGHIYSKPIPKGE